MWTFTFPEVLEVRESAKKWSRFVKIHQRVRLNSLPNGDFLGALVVPHGSTDDDEGMGAEQILQRRFGHRLRLLLDPDLEQAERLLRQ